MLTKQFRQFEQWAEDQEKSKQLKQNKQMKKMTKKELDKKMEDAVSESVSKETRYALAPLKEHVVIYMWETFVKQHIYTMEYLGYSEEEAVLNLLESDDSILYFCDFCKGYAEGVRESI